MRELNFTRSLDYRKFVVAVFEEYGCKEQRECVICSDYDEDDDDGYVWYPDMDDLYADDTLVKVLSVSYENGTVA